MKIVSSMKKRNVIFIGVFLLLLVISIIVYFLFRKNQKDLISNKSYDARSEVVWNSLHDRMEVITKGGYPEPLLEYLDTLRGKERYEWGNDRNQTFLHINQQYPDERGSVLYAIYVSYSFYLEDLEALQLDTSRTNWEKWEKREQLRSHFFPGKLRKFLFPFHPSQKPLELIYYAEDYQKKHPQTYGSERKRILADKRKQLYASDPLEFKNWEDSKFQRNILQIIYERELSVMSTFEKANFLEAKLRDWEEDHFWN